MNSTNQETKLKTLPGPWSLGEMTGNWRDIDLPDHGGVMRIVWKMEDGEGRNDALETQAHAVVAALNAASSSAPPAEQQATQVIIDFPQVGAAGPFPVVDGRVSLPDSTMQDLVRMLRPTYEAEQQAEPGAVGRTGCTAGTDEECTRRGCATSCPAQQAAPKAAPGESEDSDGFGSAEHWKEKAQYWAGVAHRLRGEALRGEPVDGIVQPTPIAEQQAVLKAAPGELTASAAKGAIMGAAYYFRDAHISGSMNLKRSAHAALEAAVDSALVALAAPQQEVSQDTMYLLRRLLSNQHTLTGPEFRAELEKIVGEAYQQEAHDGGSCADGNTPGLMPADAELLAHIKKAVPGLTRVNTALMVAKAVLEKFGSRRVASEVK